MTVWIRLTGKRSSTSGPSRFTSTRIWKSRL